MENFKVKDKEAIVAYLRKCGGAASVQAIIDEAGAERLRVYPILQEMKLAHEIEVTEEARLGAPAAVKLL